ncbi:hypothetical protein SNE40_004176 [Patella caerulea]|uniref:Uncharacterized protein n=1 Tax=Patella caerulea TaxID=87958 RepID=A0AAN8QGD4_PATCE
MADTRSVTSTEDKDSVTSSGGVFSRVFHRLSLRRKSSLSRGDGRRSLRISRKTKSFDNSFLRPGVDIRDYQNRYSDVESRNSLDELSEDSVDYSTNFKHETLYRGLLRNLLHPLGTTDKRVGLRPGDLIDHLREVFEVDQYDHERYLRQEIHNKPRQMMLGVRVIEAKYVDIADKYKDYKPYCVLQLSSNPRRSRNAQLSKVSFKPSSKGSPKGSPLLKRPEMPITIMKTQLAHSLEEPNWNEEFQLKVTELLSDELHIFVFQQNSGNDKKSEKKKQFRGLFKKLYLEKSLDVNIGSIVIPVRDIPVQGVNAWFDIFPVDGAKTQSRIGQCHLQLSLSHVQDSQHMSLFSAEDYHQASLQFHQHSIYVAEKGLMKEMSLSDKSRRLLDVFASANRISPLSQSIMDLTILLELASGIHHRLIKDATLRKAVEAVLIIWMAKQVGNKTFTERMPLSDAEICVFRTATRNYITYISSRVDELPCLFPPTLDNLTILKCKLGIVEELLGLDLWDSSSTPHEDLAERILQKLRSDLREWLKVEMEEVRNHSVMKDEVMTECTKCVEIINRLTSHCTQLGVIITFYKAFNINYYRAVILIAENTIMKEIRSQMIEMDRYQTRYHFYPVNIAQSSKLSLQLYLAIRRFYVIARETLTDRDLFRISYSQYQSWFQTTLVFWLQTFRTQCISRVEKALEIDKDVVLVTSLVKFSNSSVDTLSCFAKITEEWREIDYQLPDLAMMGVTKITDLICDGARMYADKIHNMLERNCYYDTHEEQFDVHDRLCITLNNIEHVRQYLYELPELLNWQATSESLSSKHEDDSVGHQSLITLNRLLTTTQCDILVKSKFLLQEIGNKMKVNIQQNMENLAKEPERVSAIDETLSYLSTNLETLNTRLMSSIYPIMLENLFDVVMTIFNEQLQIGRMPDYYRHMKMHFNSVSSFFIECGMDCSMTKKGNYQLVKERLEENSMSTEDLMLVYYENLANGVRTPEEYLGHLAVKAGFIEETGGNVSIHVKVIRGVNLPGLDSSGKSDPYVNISIRPITLSTKHKTKRTQVVYKSLNPTFNEDFVFNAVPECYMHTIGAVIVFTVFDHDSFSPDDFAGEIAIHMPTIEKLEETESTDSLQAMMLPLKRPKQPNHGPFQVLTERQASDKTAKRFINERLKFIYNQPKRTDGASKSTLCGFFNF